MAASRGDCIWRKAASANWLAQHSTRLEEKTHGSHAVIERPNAKRMQVEAFCRTKAAARELVAAFGGSVEQLPKDWQARLLRGTEKSIRVGRRLIVRNVPQSSRRQGGSHVLVIPASAAFGTGEHATTAMSLRMLERVSRRLLPGWRLLDAGTGSGILALAAKCFGAGRVIAIDNDPLAISVAKQNAGANKIRTITFIVGDVNRHLVGTFEIITANLYSELLRALLPRWRGSLAANGRLILSGVLRNQEPELARALASCGFEIHETRRRGKWIALLAAKAPKSQLTRTAAKRTLPHP